ncbi:type I-U CRISPR-associated RAMP protein Csb1/Cas7u [Raineyella sp. LH-20]|uniref:type I-G CRISPR-associated RAMP protein Csb1/Cas7g n=1 Tax=Raineyella sp. LH-20 TaxID=3081204 RepID=UPI002953C942|nr:type I-U CRISPR-associated RAMP protein Csb1/Cas7u [Raineyella sp. LH-20]WOP20063.1 type I-U CRISPR-associated RAMP protein Csb1/Cas7u [Raineyella sp. LH-20]
MSNRTIYRMKLTPIIGTRFQPTGFPDLGPALFQSPGADGGWIESLHVESPQSMANHLEAMTWNDGARDQVAALEGLPYVRVISPDGEFLTSSRLEAHRLASAYVMEGMIDETKQSGEQWMEAAFQLQAGRPLNHQRIADQIFRWDPVSLIHGVFFARKAWPWQPRIARAVTAFIDAYDVRAAVSGGVKTDSVEIKGGNTDTGYGMVPHQRTEYTAQDIKAFVSVDHDQIASYGLGTARTELLETLVAFQIASLFRNGLRLRTACDLEVADVDGADLPEVDQATSDVRAAIAACAGEFSPIAVTWGDRKARKTASEK